MEISPKQADWQDVSVFDAAGGAAFFERLVDSFYRHVESDSVLLSLYPDPHNLVPARRRLTLFLIQYWGGPTTYSDDRGHPRLRQRHVPFSIGERERDHWVAAMTAALDDVDPQPTLRKRFDDYFEMTATAMVNRPA